MRSLTPFLSNRVSACFFALILAFCGPVFGPSSAQDAAPERATQIQQELQAMFARLELSDEQRAALEPIMRETLATRMALLEEAGIGSGQRPNRRALRKLRGSMQDLQKRTEPKIAEILSADQLKEFRIIQEERRGRMRDEILGRRG